MKINARQRVPIHFAPDVQFDAAPESAPDREKLRELFSQLQDRLVHDCMAESLNAIRRRNLKRAANEAAAMAWTTPYPLLTMPTLFEEKARAARLHAARQDRIQMRSERLIQAAF